MIMQKRILETIGEEYIPKVEIKDDGKSILVCNMRVCLTPTECAIVAFLIERGDWVSKEELSDSISNERDITPSSIAVHISNLNRKVSLVSGRKLVEGNRDAKYRIFPNV